MEIGEKGKNMITVLAECLNFLCNYLICAIVVSAIGSFVNFENTIIHVGHIFF